MHSASEIAVNNVPAFLSKIWALVDDPTTDELIAWDSSGMSFHVYDQARFAKEILPLYFKHSNIASFIRQLNMYGFRKVVHLESGAIKTESDDIEFHHPYFMRGQEYLLENIKRKSTSAGGVVGVKTEPGLKLKEEDVNRVLTDVQLMKGKQENLSSKMDKMKKENEALWREVASLRQKHLKQQQIVNKLIQFMVHLVGGGNSRMPGSGLPKRKMPLMINDGSQMVAAKRPRYSKQMSIEELQQPEYVVKSPSSVSSEISTCGPVIQEVIDTQPLTAEDITMEAHNYSRPVPKTSQAGASLRTGGTTASIPQTYSQTKTRPEATQTNSGSQNMAVDKVSPSKDVLSTSLDSTDLNNLLQVVDPSSLPSLGDPVSNSQLLDKTDLSGQLDHMQEDIDGLKEMLSSSQYNFDPSTLLTLFNSDMNLPVNVENLLDDLEKDGGQNNLAIPSTATTSSSTTDHNTIMGNELVQFQPSDNFLAHIADLSDFIDNDSPKDSVVTPGPLKLPEISEPAENIIDPMSFINTNPVASNSDEEEPSTSLDTPLIFETID
ncbi:heat shock factor protein-like isoform X2 [Mercenaria mercenaria]|uniref:heat shock factor protein-like isoform X2 n=1 Tax=Mercenaria mercenaria TaxID=6596 RepID=UPI00234F82B1|nr:heat shock factor protein-like isoform X2 [Mercenaria mercenaria]